MTRQYILRYDPANAATMNAAFQALENVLLPTSNALELIAEETLLEKRQVISIDLGATTWRWLKLQLYATMESAGYVGPYLNLYANGDTLHDSSYYSTILESTVGGGLVGAAGADGVYIGRGDYASPAFIEMTIWPHSTGFAVISESSVLTIPSTLMSGSRFAGAYSGSLPTSLQVSSSYGGSYGTFAAGTKYRLEGEAI